MSITQISITQINTTEDKYNIKNKKKKGYL